mmetsp:Transcript_27723/g.50396  ORF Transcript_27723/g.50396 Transcript_27723/m.50396 type:complete len:100 (+) Transcript_27723:118-417(+)
MEKRLSTWPFGSGYRECRYMLIPARGTAIDEANDGHSPVIPLLSMQENIRPQIVAKLFLTLPDTLVICPTRIPPNACVATGMKVKGPHPASSPVSRQRL